MTTGTKKWFFKTALRKIEFLKRKLKKCGYFNSYLKNELAATSWLVDVAKAQYPEFVKLEEDFLSRKKKKVEENTSFFDKNV